MWQQDHAAALLLKVQSGRVHCGVHSGFTQGTQEEGRHLTGGGRTNQGPCLHPRGCALVVKIDATRLHRQLHACPGVLAKC